MACGDRGLQRIRAEGAAQLLRARQRLQAAPDQQLVPTAAVLVEQQHGFAVLAHARVQARGLDLHQRHQPVHLGFARRQRGQHAAQPQRFLAQRRPHPIIAAGGRIAFVEHQVDHAQHAGQAFLQRVAAGHFERHVGFGQRALGAHDALRHRRLRREERACDLVRGQAAQQAQRQCDPRVHRQHRVARDERQPQQVVVDVVVQRVLVAAAAFVLDVFQFPREFFVLAFEQLQAAQAVDRAALGGGHQPRPRIVRHAVTGPGLQRGDQRVLRQFFGQVQVAQHAGKAGDHARRFDAPDGIDRAMGGRCRGHGVHQTTALRPMKAAAQRRQSTWRPRRVRTVITHLSRS